MIQLKISPLLKDLATFSRVVSLRNNPAAHTITASPASALARHREQINQTERGQSGHKTITCRVPGPPVTAAPQATKEQKKKKGSRTHHFNPCL